jgi:type II secretory pathway pseudopilin PulG
MECKIISTRRSKSAFTLIELTVAAGVGFSVLAAMVSLFFFSTRSFAALTNYLELDQKTQAALDRMTREIRQMKALTACATNSITFQDQDAATISYSYDTGAKTLTRTMGEAAEIYLTSCDSLSFSLFNRAPNGTTFQPVSTTSAASTKAVELAWSCSRVLVGSKVNTESMQSAIVVVRSK